MKVTFRTALSLCLLAATGCAAVDKIDPASQGDVADQRHEREAEMISEFEKTRSAAQYSAALSSWEHGDAPSAQATLESLLAREPNHREARLLLADLLLEKGDTQAAENHLRLLISRSGDDAAAHYALGLLLDSTSRNDEALLHLRQAIALEPQNELFGMTAEAVAESPGGPPAGPGLLSSSSATLPR